MHLLKYDQQPMYYYTCGASVISASADLFPDPFLTRICAYSLMLTKFCLSALAFLQKNFSSGLFSSVRKKMRRINYCNCSVGASVAKYSFASGKFWKKKNSAAELKQDISYSWSKQIILSCHRNYLPQNH